MTLLCLPQSKEREHKIVKKTHNRQKEPFYFAGEGQVIKSITYHQLKKNVTLLASALKNLGIKKGDRVVGVYSTSSFEYFSTRKYIDIIVTQRFIFILLVDNFLIQT